MIKPQELTIDGIHTFLAVVAGEIWREHFQTVQASHQSNTLSHIQIIEASVQDVVNHRDSIQFPYPAKSKDDLLTAEYLTRRLKDLWRMTS